MIYFDGTTWAVIIIVAALTTIALIFIFVKEE